MMEVPELGAFLSMPAGTEQAFWNYEETQKRIVSMDRWGLSTGILLNLLFAKFCLRNDGRTNFPIMTSFTLMVLLLQFLQLSWAWMPQTRYQRAYLAYRMRCTLFQRVLRLSMQVVGVYLMDPEHTYSNLRRGGRSVDSASSSWRHFMLALLLTPLLGLLNTLNHPLPLRPQLVITVIKATFDMTHTVPAAAAALTRLGFEPHAHTTCKALDDTIGLFANIASLAQMPGISHVCARHTMEFVLAIAFMALTVVVPLQLTYWYERQCKLGFLQYYAAAARPQQRPANAHLGHCSPEGEEGAMVMSIAVSVIVCWWFCVLYKDVAVWLQ
jgi:hypothetical protein